MIVARLGGGDQVGGDQDVLLEMLRDEGGVKACADRAGADEKVSLHFVAVCDAATLLLTA